MTKKKQSVGGSVGTGAGIFMENIVDFINVIFIRFKVVVMEILLFGLAAVEALQGIFAKGGETQAEASALAKSFGHIGLFLVGMVAGLIYAKELSDVGKSVKEKKAGNFVAQLLQFSLVFILMGVSIIGQTSIVLSAYGLADQFMTLFLVKPLYPLIGMLEHGSFVTMTVYIAYVHFIVLMYVGSKQLGNENFDAPYQKEDDKEDDKKDKDDSEDNSTNIPLEYRQLKNTLNKNSPLKKKDYAASTVEKAIENKNLTVVAADVLNKFINGENDKTRAANAVSQYIGLEKEGKELIPFKQKIKKLVGGSASGN